MMNDTVLVLVVLGVAVGGLVLVASRLDRRAKTEGSLLTGKPTVAGRIFACLFAIVLFGFTLLDLSNGGISLLSVLLTILAIALIAYALGAYSLFQRK
jgi:hypothetical protein